MKRIFCFSIIVLSLALAPRKGFGQWVQTNGPYGAWVFCITHLGDNIFIGTEGGIFKSTDHGSNWQRRSNGLPDGLYIYSLTTHGTNVFAGTSQHGIYRSTDSGASWSSASFGLPNSYSAYSLGSSSHLVFAPQNNLYMSSNDGLQWRLADTNLMKIAAPETVFTIDSITYAAGEWITQTTDEGLTWTVTAVPFADHSWYIYSMANIGQILFAVDRNSGILRSINHGESWDTAMTGLPPPFTDFLFLATVGNNLFAGAYDGSVYRTSDSANTWQLASSGLPTGANLSALASNGNELLAGFYGPGIFRSFDTGKTWSECNQGLINTSVNAIASIGDTTIVGTDAGVFLTIDNGSSWQPKHNGLTSYNIASILIGGKNLYAGGEGLFLSTNGGENWNESDAGIKGTYIRTMIRNGNPLLAGGDYELFYSATNGETWYPSLQNEIYDLLNVGSEVFVATNDRPRVSTDEGSTWTALSYGITFQEQLCIKALGMAGSKVFLSRFGPYGGSKGAIFLTDDTAARWYRAPDSSVPSRGSANCFAPVGNAMFVATDSDGIFLTTDAGNSWTRENSGLGDSSVLLIAVQGNELLAGTASSGVWRRPLAEMIAPSSVASEKLPSETISVYPDPASSLVTIDCPNLKGATDASLISITGVTVWHRTLNADGRPFQLDFNGVANGAYRIELVAGDVRQTCNIVLKR